MILHFHLVNEHVCPMLNVNNSVLTCATDVPYKVVWIAVVAIILATGIISFRAAQRV